MTLIHFSDIHLTAARLGWRPADFASKKVTGWVNVRLLGRGKRFQHAPRIVAALMREIRERRPDGLVFSGDATMFGFPAEFAAATAALGVDDATLPPAVAVPGNHDTYTKRAVRAGLFEAAFAPWQQGIRVGEETYPFARKIGGLWLIGMNSCTANRVPIDASGAIAFAELDRLRTLVTRLDAGPRILVTHYPLRTSTNKIEPRLHRLRNHKAALAAAKEAGIHLWLHGHIHHPFALPASPTIPFPVICGGSSTQTDRWAYHEYTIADGQLTAVRWTYNLATDCFMEATRFAFPLPAAAS